jgi:hypothetical protein
VGSSEYAEWKNALLKTSKQCYLCGSKYRPQVHHLDSLSYLIQKYGITKENWKRFVHILFDPENGVVLCYKHHNKSNGISLHAVFGRKQIIKEHYILYEKMYQEGNLKG